MALEKLGDKSAAPVLAAVLDKPDIRGHAFLLDSALPLVPGHANESANLERSLCLREIAVARALVRLGDFEGNLFGLGLGVPPHRLQLAAHPFVALHLVDKDLGSLRKFVEMGCHRILDCSNNTGADIGVAELVFGLTFEYRILYSNGNSGRKAFSDIFAMVRCLKELVYCL